MKKTFWAFGILALLGTTSAMAADVVAPAPYDWSGKYIGVQGGFLFGNVNQNIPAYPQPVPVGTLSGGAVGLYAGVRKQVSPKFVLGAELSGDFMFVDGNNLSGGVGAERLDTKQSWDASLVAKAGIPVNNILIYGLGGGTLGGFNSQYTAFPVSSNVTAVGWTVGGGIEAALKERLTARIEYRYTSFGQVSVQCSTCGPTFISPAESLVTVGIGYKF